MSTPNMDDDHPAIQLMKRVDEVIKEVSPRHLFAAINDRILFFLLTFIRVAKNIEIRILSLNLIR